MPLPRKVAAMPHRTWSAALAALCLLVAADAPQQQQTTLRYKFKKGDKLDYAADVKSVLKIRIAGSPTTEYGMRFEWTSTVQDVDGDGKATILCKLDRLRVARSGLGT